MRDGAPTADCDMHVQEPGDLWVRYIDKKFASRAPRGVGEFSRDAAVDVDGRRVPQQRPLSRLALTNTQNAQRTSRYDFAERRAYDAVSQLEAMDMEGLDRAVLFPTLGLFVLAVDDLEPALAAAIARAYNDWLHDFCGADRKRLVGAAMLAPHDVPAACAEARRAVRELGHRAIFLRPNPIGGKFWHHEAYDPLWETLSELNVPVCFHEGGSGCKENPYLSQMGEWFDLGMMGHVVSHPFGVIQALIAFCMGGVLERFPKLRAGFFEANASWVPWMLWRMDSHFEWRGPTEAPHLKIKPSEHFARACYVTIDPDEASAVPFVKDHGGRNVVFSTDYPHGDAKFPGSMTEFFKLPLGVELQRKILWENWVELYGET